MKLRYLAGCGAPFLALYQKGSSLLRNADSRYVKVLLYHHIPESRQELFKHQIQFLTSHYDFLTPLQFQEFIEGKSSFSSVSLLITFDDGFKSNRIVAEEILEPLGIKGIFFVPTEFIGLQDAQKRNEFIARQIYGGHANNSEIFSDMEPLTWEDLKYLLAQGHVVGSHGRNHRRLSSIHSQQDLHDEIVESGNILEEKLGIPITCFAYPFGDIDSISKQAFHVMKARYPYCFSGVRGANYRPTLNYAILRDAISIDDPPQYVRFIIESGLDVIYKKKISRLIELAGR